MTIDSTTLVRNAFKSVVANPPDLREVGDQEGEVRYIEALLPSYERTVSDLLRLFPGRENLQGLNFVELGAFLGIVSKALSLALARVIACDIPEFFARENVKSFYEAMGVEIQSFNLRNYSLPFTSSSQDCVVACEVFEHLNFNPIPVFVEINRILKTGGHFYIAMPNGGYFLKRIKYLISGDTPGFSVAELFSQLNPNQNMVVGLHWKEYSLNQTIEMVSALGFQNVQAITRNDTGSGHRSSLKKLLKMLVPGGDTQVAIFRKTRDFDGKFSISADS